MLERIGAIVRLTRERAELSLAALADRSGVPLHLLVALEHGTPGITTTQLDDVAVALALEPTALLNGREVPETKRPENTAASRSVAALVERAHREALLTDGDARVILGLDRLAPLPWERGEL